MPACNSTWTSRRNSLDACLILSLQTLLNLGVMGDLDRLHVSQDTHPREAGYVTAILTSRNDLTGPHALVPQQTRFLRRCNGRSKHAWSP